MVKRTIIWENAAKQQLKLLYQYIKEDSPQNAEKVRNEILWQVKQAAVHPENCSSDKFKLHNDGSYRAFELHR